MKGQQVCVGDYVSWRSQAGGYAKAKEGDVIAIVLRLDDASRYVPVGAPGCRLKFQDVNRIFDRVLVAVRRRSGSYDYYAPSMKLVKVVE
jgi:hypothetical protein